LRPQPSFPSFSSVPYFNPWVFVWHLRGTMSTGNRRIHNYPAYCVLLHSFLALFAPWREFFLRVSESPCLRASVRNIFLGGTLQFLSHRATETQRKHGSINVRPLALKRDQRILLPPVHFFDLYS
jgi:hypothetical protein